ncbi:aminopeptidase P family protein [Aquirufa aurantiipilula]|uniref:aminopeptidase P family protein n=1 Tax=Aquirufa aurantiipilula TaxID=2696561 RepID=UPI001CAA65F6|nr:aminopeptidase P family protein [Aquirufa aurantiipilula]MBZ1325411.1 aminopeptidase P family protein [Aquirufa aurantiipilula]
MRYDTPPAQLYINNRQKLISQLAPKSIVLICSNDIMPTNADGSMGFKQNSDLFYLSGLDQEETILLLYPDAPEEHLKEIAFVRETSELISIWEGHKFTKEEAQHISGIKNIQWTQQFEAILQTLIYTVENIYLVDNEHIRNSSTVETQNARFTKSLQAKYPTHTYKRLAPITNTIRMKKEADEIKAMQKAVDITESAFRRVLEFTQPGVTEYEIEAEFIHEFIRLKGDGFAYTPIIASGANACVLHYIENKGVCQDGDLILLDVGAAYGNYNADMTRTIPVNGKFSPRQKQVYLAVHDVLNFASQLMRPSIYWVDYQKEVERYMEGKLIDLGLFSRADVEKQDKNAPLFKKYFMHGVAHHLGLDVHDVWDKYKPFEAGMVLTCEPGIYIREEGLGIRLENNLLITSTGTDNLMKHIPIEWEEIESIMQSKY